MESDTVYAVRCTYCITGIQLDPARLEIYKVVWSVSDTVLCGLLYCMTGIELDPARLDIY